MTAEELLVRISADINDFVDGVEDADESLGGFISNAEKGSKVLLGVVGLVGGAMLVLGADSVRMAGEMEQTEKAFETLIGNAEESEKLLDDLADFAKSTPFDLIGLQDSSKQLLAYGFEVEEIIPLMGQVGDAVSAVGGGSNEIDRVIRAFGQMKAKGKLSAEEMNQIAELGIPVWQMLADSIGVDVPKAQEMASKGAIDVSDAMDGILKGMERYEGAMDSQSKTLIGMWSNTKDNIDQIKILLGQEIMENLGLKDALEKINGYLENFLGLLDEKGLKGALKDLIPPELVGNLYILGGAIISALIPAVISLATAFWGLLAPLLPFIFIGALIGAVIYLIIEYFDDFINFVNKMAQIFNNWLSNLWNSIVNYTKGIADTFNNWLSNLWNSIVNYTKGIAQTFNNWLNNLKNKIVEKWNSIIDFFKSIPIKIKSALSYVKIYAYEVFSNMGKSIINYVSSLPSKLYEKAKNIASNFWNGFKKGLGISSPSYVERAFMSMGDSAFNTLDTMRSVAPKIQSALSNSIKPIDVNINGNMNNLYGNSYNSDSNNIGENNGENSNVSGVNIVINEMNVRNDQDIIKIAQELYKLQKFEYRAKGGVFNGI